MKRRSIPTDIGISDGEIESYRKYDDVLEVIVKAWNERRLSVTFTGVVRMLDNDSGDLDDLCEVTEKSDFLLSAIDHVYDTVPSDIPYKHFQFVGVEGHGILDVVAELITITVNDIGTVSAG